MHRCIGDNMEIVVPTLVHHELLSRNQLQRTLIKVEDLLKQLPIEVVDQVQLPIPDIIILVCQKKTMVLDLFLCLIGCLRVSLLQIGNQ